MIFHPYTAKLRHNGYLGASLAKEDMEERQEGESTQEKAQKSAKY